MDVFNLIGGEVSSDEDEDVIERMGADSNRAIREAEVSSDKTMDARKTKVSAREDAATKETEEVEHPKQNERLESNGAKKATNMKREEKKIPSGVVKKIYFIGLGLGSEKDVTVRGLEAIRSCDAVFLEAYTSILPGVDVSKLESFYGKPITIADRDLVESKSDTMLKYGKGACVALLVVGDPFGATTHSDLFLRAKEMGIDVEVVHNASIMNAVGCCGLQLYRFGHTVSIPFFREQWKPDSFYDPIRHNRAGELHTLCLLDIKVKEPDFEELVKTGRTKFLPPRYMTVRQAIDQLLYVEEQRKGGAYGPETMCVAVARVGQASQKIVAAPMRKLRNVDMGGPLHSMVIVGKAHDFELKMLNCFSIEGGEIEED